MPERREEALHNAAVGTVGSKQSHKRAYARYDGGNHKQQHDVAERVESFRIGIMVLFPFLAKPSEAVLHYSERTDYGTVKSSEKQSEENQGQNHPDVKSEEGGQELDLGHPSEKPMDRSREIKE